jgi:hypothetical protein
MRRRAVDAQRGDAEEVVGLAASGKRPHQRQHTISHRNPPGSARLRAFDSHTFRLGPLHNQDRHRNFNEVANTHGTQL